MKLCCADGPHNDCSHYNFSTSGREDKVSLEEAGPGFHGCQSVGAAREPGRDAHADQSVVILHAKVAQKSYGNEKRFFCPPPCVYIRGRGWKVMQDHLKAAGYGDSVYRMCGYMCLDNSSQSQADTFKLVFDEQPDSTQMFACAKSLFISDQDKRKHFRLLLRLFLGNRQEVGSFQSRLIKVISKPSQKRQSMKNVDLCISSCSRVALFNRLRSQTVSTRYLSVDRGAFVASARQWTAFTITMVEDQSADQGDFVLSEGFICYGAVVQLVCTESGVALPPMVIRKVNKQQAILDVDEPVSQLHNPPPSFISLLHLPPSSPSFISILHLLFILLLHLPPSLASVLHPPSSPSFSGFSPPPSISSSSPAFISLLHLPSFSGFSSSSLLHLPPSSPSFSGFSPPPSFISLLLWLQSSTLLHLHPSSPSFSVFSPPPSFISILHLPPSLASVLHPPSSPSFSGFSPPPSFISLLHLLLLGSVLTHLHPSSPPSLASVLLPPSSPSFSGFSPPPSFISILHLPPSLASVLHPPSSPSFSGFSPPPSFISLLHLPPSLASVLHPPSSPSFISLLLCVQSSSLLHLHPSSPSFSGFSPPPSFISILLWLQSSSLLHLYPSLASVLLPPSSPSFSGFSPPPSFISILLWLQSSSLLHLYPSLASVLLPPSSPSFSGFILLPPSSLSFSGFSPPPSFISILLWLQSSSLLHLYPSLASVLLPPSSPSFSGFSPPPSFISILLWLQSSTLLHLHPSLASVPPSLLHLYPALASVLLPPSCSIFSGFSPPPPVSLVPSLASSPPPSFISILLWLQSSSLLHLHPSLPSVLHPSFISILLWLQSSSLLHLYPSLLQSSSSSSPSLFKRVPRPFVWLQAPSSTRDPSRVVLNDGSCWTIIGVEMVEFTFNEGLTCVQTPVSPFPVIIGLEVNGGGHVAMMEILGENFSPHLKVWFGNSEAETMFKSPKSLLCVVPDVSVFSDGWRSLRRVLTVPLSLIRLDGLIYRTSFSFTYTPELQLSSSVRGGGGGGGGRRDGGSDEGQEDDVLLETIHQEFTRANFHLFMQS
ncbi:unnamed protein product [Pleuronectes platessa]|uniref:Recombining binding protein suppressor of hairless-like protein n=1 Tax=Pleuronectes platessa TaxID=8262 RepID=A0A9N7UP27_PLEPL|nr:unnamed protein product [Pleuronectes platessa]